MSDAVLNRYTSDSWSLELTGQSSALSRWTRRPVVKDEHFRLSLLGFETGAAPISWLEGDRPLLEDLHRTVETYVQQNLQQSTLAASAGSAAELTPLEPLPSKAPQISSNGTIVADNPFGQTEQNSEGQTLLPGQSSGRPSQTFQIEKEGTLAHRLQYRPTATQPRSLKLTTVQLADLLEVLDRWQNESMALPPEASSSSSNVIPGSFAAMPAWGRVAASAAIALGAAGGGIYLLTSQSATQLASTEAEGDVAAESADAGGLGTFPQVSTNPSGTLPNAQARGPGFSAPFLKQRDSDNPDAALADDPSLPPSAILPGSEGGLPNIPTDEFLIAEGDTTVPGSPEFSTVPLPEEGLSPDLGLPDSSSVNLGLPDSSVVPATSAASLPDDDSLVPDDRFLPGVGLNAANIGADVDTTIAQQTDPAPSPVPDVSTDPMSPVTPTNPTLETFPSSTASTSYDNAQDELAANVAEADFAPAQPTGQEATVAAASDVPEAEPSLTEDASGSSEPGVSARASGPVEKAAADVEAAEPAVTATTAPPPQPSLPPVAIAKPQASVEQVSENQSAAVKQYFESRWTPPAELEQPLQYQLILSGEGSIERMNPLSPAATEYADQAGIPDVGEAFIEPSTGIQDSTVVLTLGADGQVQVSVENVTPE